MKKKLLKATAAVLAVACCVGALGCKGQNDGGMDGTKVYLQALPDANAAATGTVQADYYLLAEPAVSAQAKNGFSIKGDLQALYGGESGYPQAVLVAKTELIENHSAWVSGFVQKLGAAAKWLEEATGEEVVAAIGAHMDDPETATSLKAPLLNADVMGRCGVRFTYASECKMEVNGFLSRMIDVNEKAAAMPADGFYWTAKAVSRAATVSAQDITVCMPDGAPALAMAKLMSEDTAEDGVEYRVVTPTLISSKVTNKDQEKNADLCVLPVTAASKLLGTGTNYKMLGVVTHGNLYLVAKDGKTVTAENIQELKGKKIGVLQINEVPGLTLKTVLNKYGVPFEEVKNN